MAEAPSPRSLLDPLLVAKLPTMELRARRVVEGAMAGRHRSAQRGQALEFAAHRPYVPGDEWRRIDWKVYAKTDRWTVREQQDESNLRATIFLDLSRSMAYAGPGRLPKLRYAAILSAALAYLLVHRREAVGLGFAGGPEREILIPTAGGTGQLARLFAALEQASAGGAADWRRVLADAGQRLPRRGVVVLVSDLLAPPEDLLAALRTLLARKHEVLVWQVLDPDELDFPFDGDTLFEDMETGASLRVDAAALADEYRRRRAERQALLARSFASLGVDAHVFRTDRPLDRELALFLQRRRALAGASARGG